VIRSVGRTLALSLALAASGTVAVTAADSASATPPNSVRPALAARACPPAAYAVSFSDSLNKVIRNGATLGGLSSLAYDPRSAAWVSAVDNHGTDPARIWFFRNLFDPTVVRDPLVLKKPDGTPYDGTTSDNEGLAVLPDGDYLVSSETEPSIRIFGRDGVQKGQLPVPARFAVTGTTPAGQATGNATLEGLTISPSGDEIIAAMEAPLSGDVSATSTSLHRFLVYRADRRGSWTLTKQIAYRTDPGMRVPEVAAYGENSFVVEEASFTAPPAPGQLAPPVIGNAVSLFAVTGLDRAVDVSDIANLSSAPAKDVVKKTLVGNLVQCPSLGAPALEPQTNPLLDNFEGMAITTPSILGYRGISLIVDDNFSATEITRVLNLEVKLP
jgi:uncharacterized protein